jgi:hypothetical protein
VPIHPAEAFSNLVETYFGQGSCSPISNAGNKITEAVADPSNELFRENLQLRLDRLAKAYESPSPSRDALLKALRGITTRNWDGAYAELVAYSYFVTPKRNSATYLEPPSLNVNLDKSRTYCAQLGGAVANVDGHFTEEDVYFEVKVLQDNVKDFLDRIFKDVKRELKCDELYLTAEYDAAVYCGALKERRQALLHELVAHFDSATKPDFLTSKVVTGFSFRATWGPGVLVSTKSYNPYRHSKELHGGVFGHMNQFVRDRPFVLVYVIPWFNNLITDFRNHNRYLYRSLSRRVFCQYKQSTDTAKAYNPHFSGPETLWDLSQNISAIAFLEDKSLKDITTKSKVDAFWYLNPNAKNLLSSSFFYDVLAHDLEHDERDDFIEDNY